MEDKQPSKISMVKSDLPCRPIESVELAATVVAAEETSVVVIYRSKQSN